MINNNKNITFFLALVLLIFSILLTGCEKNGVEKNKNEIVIAEQYGLAYAPLIVAKEMKIFEKNLNYEVRWIKLGNTIAIREAMVSGELDVGFMGIPPFLIGYDNQMNWKIFTGLSECPVDLIGKKENVQRLEDINENDKIALPQPGSIQHILLSMGAEKYLKNGNIFDNQLVTMNHQDAFNSMVGDTDIKYHFTSPPYNFEEMKINGASKILSGKDAFGGDFTFIVGVLSENFMENNENKIDNIKKSLNEAMEIINSDREKTLDLLENYFSIDRNDLEEYIYGGEIEYSSSIKGVDKFSEFMNTHGYLKEKYYEEELIYKEE